MLLSFPCWRTYKTVANLAYRDISRTIFKQSVLFPPITELATLLGTFNKSEVYLRIRPLLFSIVCLDCFNIVGLYQSFIDPNPDLGIPFRSSNKL